MKKRNPITNYISKTSIIIIVLLLLPSPLSPLTLAKAFALTASNDNFMIDIGDIDTNVDTTQYNKPKKSEVAATQTAPGVYTGKNYTVKEGFDGHNPNSPFSFGLSQTRIDFGTLSATNPVTRTNKLLVISPASLYQVFTFEDHQLRFGPTGQIHDTTCDNGGCSHITQSLWISNLTYGFGYRCDNTKGNDCVQEFSEADNYKQFPSVGEKEVPVAVMLGQQSNNEHQATITYKINIAGTQLPGSYTNTIMYIGAPGY